MNSNLLQKCLDELAKESPKLDYVRGILETVIEMSQPTIQEAAKAASAVMVAATKNPEPQIIDEAASLDAATAAMLKRIPPTLET